MAWSITERFPSWGETGTMPADGFFYEGGDQVNEKHLDALWNGISGLEEDVQSALNDIDSDGDGVVDKADALAAAATLDGDLSAANGETIWDESATYIPQARLQNDSITVSGGDGLKNGGTVQLGDSLSLDIEPADFAGSGLSDDGDDNLQINAGNQLTINGGQLDVQEGDGSGLDADTVDGLEGAALQTAVSEDGTERVSGAGDINFINGISVADDGDGTVTVNSDENSLAYNFVMW